MSLGPVIGDTVESLQHEANAKGLTFGTQGSSSKVFSTDVDRLRQVLMNLSRTPSSTPPPAGASRFA